MTDRKILIFAGTTEGRKLAEVLAEHAIPCVVCVATEYGAQLMRETERPYRMTVDEGLPDLRQGRLDAEEMCTLMQEETFAAVVDATHPFAVEVSENIRLSAGRCGILYLRLKRNTRSEKAALQETEGDGLYFFRDSEACAAFLAAQNGSVLLTTGSKELHVFCRETLKERLYVRVLPGRESIGLCEEAGIPGGRILALQGPFSEELNLALIRQYGIRWLVTKESGPAGGYSEKIRAAARAGIPACVIGNPEKGEGLSFGQVLERLSEILDREIKPQQKLEISLIGVGMGSTGNMTREAYEACRAAGYVFGAKRLLTMIGEMQEQAVCYPYYTAEAILPVLEEVMVRNEQNPCDGGSLKIAVLFSGDSGFYSGCSSLQGALCKWAEKKEQTIEVRVYPGISSVSYLAAALGQSWQDAAIFSTHGKGKAENWAESLRQTVKTHRKTFVLTSGVEDVRAMGGLFAAKKVSVWVGRDLSYPEMKVCEYTPAACAELTEKGSYICLIANREAESEEAKGTDEDPKDIRDCAGDMKETGRMITHGMPDTAFIREEQTKVIPMTKEEVREVAISKLHLTSDAVVFDIGSGTGSVSVEIARLLPGVRVYAWEQKEEAVRLTERNAARFGLDNLTVLHRKAPEGIEELPVPTHVFIGGSDGALHEILAKLRERNPKVRIVITAVSLETVSRLTEEMREWNPAEVVNLQVSKSRLLGRYHLMQAENPVYIVSLGGEESI